MRVLIGDLFQSKCKTLVNTVNCVGVMGKGVAKVFKEKYPDMYNDYVLRCNHKMVRPGQPYLFSNLFDVSILNFPTKDHWRSSSRISYIRDGLDWFRSNWAELGIESIAFPPLGCGNGGLSWDEVGPLMYSKLKDLPIDIELYAPFGTPLSHISEDFMSKSFEKNLESCGKQQGRYRKVWDIILYVIKKLDNMGTAPCVGRTIYQKICYLLCRQGVPLGFYFEKDKYGPYSKDAQNALVIFANANRIIEQTIGTQHSMIRISASKTFDLVPELYEDEWLVAANSVIDFFSRIRNTEQAEKYTTLLWCYDECCNNIRKNKRASDTPRLEVESIIDAAVAWKPHWNTPETRDSLKNEIYALMMQDWISSDDVAHASAPAELF